MTTCQTDLMNHQASDKLSLVDICHRFVTATLDAPLFQNLSLSVAPKQVVSIIGTSGVGKSTLFNIAAGLICPQSGQVIIDGKDCTGVAGQVGYMLQKDLLLPFKTIYDNIALPMMLQGMDKMAIQARIKPNLSLFGLDGLADKYPHQLSGGQRQRAALLRTYLSNDHLMLLDEPFSALDFVTKSEMYAWFNAFRHEKGLTCLMITHDIDEAIYLSDCVYVLKGFPASLAHRFEIPKQDGFMKSQDFLLLKERILTVIKG